MDDTVSELFRQISEGNIDKKKMFFQGYMTYDDKFRKVLKNDDLFIARGFAERAYPSLEDIPDIVRPSMKGMVEIMRGCGVGCDFCEVTLRPLRYYPLDKIKERLRLTLRVDLPMPGFIPMRYSNTSMRKCSHQMRMHFLICLK